MTRTWTRWQHITLHWTTWLALLSFPTLDHIYIHDHDKAKTFWSHTNTNIHWQVFGARESESACQWSRELWFIVLWTRWHGIWNCEYAKARCVYFLSFFLSSILCQALMGTGRPFFSTHDIPSFLILFPFSPSRAPHPHRAIYPYSTSFLSFKP